MTGEAELVEAALRALDSTRRKLVAMLAVSPAPGQPWPIGPRNMLESLVVDVTNRQNELVRMRSERAARTTPPRAAADLPIDDPDADGVGYA